MNDDELRITIFGLLRKIAPGSEPEKLKDDDDIRQTLDMDSFDALQFIASLEENLSVSIPEEDYGKVRTLKNLLEYLRKSGLPR